MLFRSAALFAQTITTGGVPLVQEVSISRNGVGASDVDALFIKNSMPVEEELNFSSFLNRLVNSIEALRASQDENGEAQAPKLTQPIVIVSSAESGRVMMFHGASASTIVGGLEEAFDGGLPYFADEAVEVLSATVEATDTVGAAAGGVTMF